MNKFYTLANSILESLNEADAVTNVVKGITRPVGPGVTTRTNIPAADVQKIFPNANLGGTNQPPVAPTSTNQPPRNIAGAKPPYDPSRDPLLQGVEDRLKNLPKFPKPGTSPSVYEPKDLRYNRQRYLDRRKQMDAERAARNAAYIKRREDMKNK